MPKGTMKYFSNPKGFGFITPDEGGDDVFAHFSAIQMEGYKFIKAGARVDYEIGEPTPKGIHAVSVILIPEAEEGVATSEPSPEG